MHFTFIRKIILISSGILLLKCSNDLPDHVPRIIFQNNDLKISTQDWEKYINIRKKNISVFSPDSMISWKNQFIKENLILIDTYNKNYHFHTELNAMVNRVARKILTQPEGIIYKRYIADQVNIPRKLLIEISLKRQIVYDLEYLRFINRSEMNKCFPGSAKIFTSDTFDKAVLLSAKNSNIEHKIIKWNRMTVQFAGIRDKIYSLKKNEVSEPIVDFTGITIIRINNITKSLKNKSYNSSSTHENDLVRKLEMEHLAYKFDNEIFKKANIVINEENSDHFWEIIKYKKISSFNEEEYGSYLQNELMEYSLEEKRENVTVEKFTKYYNDLAMRSDLLSKNKFYYYLRDMAWEANILRYAEKSGLTKDPNFLQEKLDYKNRLMVNFYVRDRLREIEVKEMEDYYKRNISRFNMSTHAIVDLFYFASEIDAYKASKKLRINNIAGVKESKGFLKSEQCEIKFDDDLLPPQLVKNIFDPEFKLARIPYKLNSNEYVICNRLNFKGERYKPFKEVQEQIHNHLFDLEYKKTKQALQDSLFNISSLAKIFLQNIQ